MSRSPFSPYSQPSPLPDDATLALRKQEAAAWFRALRDRICARFEDIEQQAAGPFDPRRAGPAISCARRGSGRTPPGRMAAAAR